jgi:CheY-like chemotaxis protein
MVVEDEPDIYDVLLAMFEIWGIEGVAFVDGAEAVAWIEDVDKGNVVNELPELAILDIRLPEIPGPEVGARLRKSERLGKVAVVMITAYRLSPDEEEQVKARAQADALMYKPLPAMPELRKTLDQIIAKRRNIAASAATTAATTKPAPPVPSASSPAASPVPPKSSTPPTQAS